ncbi:MAG: hypothetical protein QM541_09435 [Flavobacterium sp.]|nr:hypothetical protein [Flavobacterium sp.]
MTLTELPKLLSLANLAKKMSKSLGYQHVVPLFEDEISIRRKVKITVTDIGPKTNEMSSGVANFFELLKACHKIDAHTSLMNDYKVGALKYSELKENVANSLVELSKEFISRKAELTNNEKEIKEQVFTMSKRARVLAKETIKEVREMVGHLKRND